MIDTEAFINQLYWFLKENRYIDKTPNAAREEMFLFQKGALNFSVYPTALDK